MAWPRPEIAIWRPPGWNLLARPGPFLHFHDTFIAFASWISANP
jgi:hypothetical protein